MNERKIVCEDLNLAIDDLRREGFRLDVIYPADDPKAAVLSRGIERVRVSLKDAPLLLDRLAPFVPAFVLTRAGASPAAGRAEMLYRDLIPGRLGGRYVASHITIPEGGAVDDWVHYHRVALQIIVVRRGWVRVVYEDQGEPFVMKAGDVVLQPPGIRHRVLESSVGLEVVEISAPALHENFADHELQLPNARPSDRSFGGQSFLHQLASKTPWSSFHQAEARETAMRKATGGLADVRTIRRGSASTLDVPPHDGELVLGFVLDGRARLVDIDLGPADAFVIRPSEAWSLKDMSEDFRLLHITTARLD